MRPDLGAPANDIARSEILLGRVRDRDVDVRRAESGGRGHRALEAEATTDSGGRTTTTRGLGTLHGGAGNTLALLRLDANDALAAETAAVLTWHPFRENSLANRPSSPLWPQLARPRDGRNCLQWCTGAPGVLAGAWGVPREDLLLAGAELTWRAGAHGDERGHGICHGTSGNGFALKAFARTGDDAGSSARGGFAVHTLRQAERLRATYGRRRYSLWTGDVGSALFAAACLNADARYPIIDVV
jgi:hypothetical protein